MNLNKTILISALATLLGVANVDAQIYSKSQLTTANNTTITINGTESITGSVLNTFNNQIIGSICGLFQASDCVLPAGVVVANLGFTPLKPNSNLADLKSISAARANLGLGTMALANFSSNNTFTATNIFTSNPQFSNCVGYPYSTGSTPFACATTIPTTALSGTISNSQLQPGVAAANLAVTPAPTTSLTFTQLGTGAATITADAHLKAQCIEFTDFTGADPTDTNYNDTAWTNFVNQVISTGRCGHVTSGTYKFQNQAVLNTSPTQTAAAGGVSLYGDGVQRTVFDMKTTSSPAFMIEAPFSGANAGVVITTTTGAVTAGLYAIPTTLPTYGLNIGDNVAVQTTGVLFSSTIASLAANTITLATPLPANVANGAAVYDYTGGTYGNPSYSLYINFLDIGIKGTVPAGSVFAIGNPNLTDQINAINARVWVENYDTGTSADDVGCYIGAIFGRSLIEGTCGETGVNGDSLRVAASSFSTFRVNAGGGGHGIHIYGNYWNGTGSISGNTLTIASTAYGTPRINQTIYGTGITNGVFPGYTPMITAQIDSTHYTVSGPSLTIATEALIGAGVRNNTYSNLFQTQDTEVNGINDLLIDQPSVTSVGNNTFIGGQWNYGAGGVGALAVVGAQLNNQLICPSFSAVGTPNNIVASEPGKLTAFCNGVLTTGNQPASLYLSSNVGGASISLDNSGNVHIANAVTSGADSYEVATGGNHQQRVNGAVVQLNSAAADANLVASADQSYTYQVETTGFTYTIPNATSGVLFDPAGTIAAGTVTFPAAPTDGQKIQIGTSQTITALSVNANAGQTNKCTGATVALTQATPLHCIYRVGNTTWYPN